jgi:hypothetical protein
MTRKGLVRAPGLCALAALAALTALTALGCGAHPSRPGSPSRIGKGPGADARVERFADGKYRLALHHIPLRRYRTIPPDGIAPPAVGARVRFAEVACESFGPRPPDPKTGRPPPPPSPTCAISDAAVRARAEVRAMVDRIGQCYPLERWQPSADELAAIAAGRGATDDGSAAIVVWTRHVTVTPPHGRRIDDGLLDPTPSRGAQEQERLSTTTEVRFGRDVHASPTYAAEEIELVFFETERGSTIDAPLARAIDAAAGGRSQNWARASALLRAIDTSAEPLYVRVLVGEDLAIAALFSGDYVAARDALREVRALSPSFDLAGRDMDRELDPHMRKSLPTAHYANFTILEEIVSGAFTLRDPCGPRG